MSADIADGEMTAADTMLASARADLAADLKRIAADPARRVFAVFDGAQFDDIDASLMEAQLAHRSLYINVDDLALVDAGPWLVDFYADPPEPDPTDEELADFPEEEPLAEDALSDEALQAEADRLAAQMKAAFDAGDETGGGQLAREGEMPALPSPEIIAARIDAAVALLETCPNAAVFWIGDASLTEQAMWKHARSINRVMIPREFADENWETPEEEVTTDSEVDVDIEAPDGTRPSNIADISHTDVMFRHADGNVLAEVMPVLDSTQFARLFGPAKAFTFLAPDHPSQSSGSAMRRAILPDDEPQAQAGFLWLSDEQLSAIEDARLERLKYRLGLHLRKVTGEAPKNISDEAIRAHVNESIRTADGLAFKKESSWRRWTHLMYLTQGKIALNSEIMGFIQDGTLPVHVDNDPNKSIPKSSDERMKAAMQFTIEDLERRRAQLNGIEA